MYTVFCGRQVAATATGGQISSSSVIDLEASDDIAEHSTSDSTGADATSRPSSHVEPVSPVIGRYLQKATTARCFLRQPEIPRNYLVWCSVRYAVGHLMKPCPTPMLTSILTTVSLSIETCDSYISIMLMTAVDWVCFYVSVSSIVYCLNSKYCLNNI